MFDPPVKWKSQIHRKRNAKNQVFARNLLCSVLIQPLSIPRSAAHVLTSILREPLIRTGTTTPFFYTVVLRT